MSDGSLWKWQDRYEVRKPGEDLQQGDVVLVKGLPFEKVFSRSDSFVILNQSCDLARQNQWDKKIPTLTPRMRTALVSPVVSACDFFQVQLSNKKLLENSKRFQEIIWWNHALYAYLPPDCLADTADVEGLVIQDHSIIVLEEIYSLELWHTDDNSKEGEETPNLSGYKEIAKLPRVGLSSPWAERIGWMAGCLFSRIGTPDPKNRSELQKEIADQIRTRFDE